MSEDKYPHWKEALLGNDGAVANLRCAVKYGFWHVGYALLAVLGVVLLAGAWALDRVTGTETVARVRSAFGHPYVSDAVDLIVAWACGIVLGLYASMLIIEVIRDPMLLVWGVALVLAGLAALAALLVGAVFLWEKTKQTRRSTVEATTSAFHRAAERAVETPGVRRVYGECPVSMDIEPKWFDRLTEAFE